MTIKNTDIKAMRTFTLIADKIKFYPEIYVDIFYYRGIKIIMN